VKAGILFGSSPNRAGGKGPKDSPPRGCVPPLTGQNRREQPGFRSGCPGSARHLSPIRLRKTESLPRSGQQNHDQTRTDERTTASLCPVRGGMRPLGPSRTVPALAAGIPGDGKSTEITHRLGGDPLFFLRIIKVESPPMIGWRKRWLPGRKRPWDRL
jgi:hypothetical protein